MFPEKVIPYGLDLHLHFCGYGHRKLNHDTVKTITKTKPQSSFYGCFAHLKLKKYKGIVIKIWKRTPGNFEREQVNP